MTKEEKLWIFERYTTCDRKAQDSGMSQKARDSYRSKAALLYSMIYGFRLVGDYAEYLAEKRRKQAA